MVTVTENVVGTPTDFAAATTRPSAIVTVKALVPERAGGVATGAIFLRVCVCVKLRERRGEGGRKKRERGRRGGGEGGKGR